MRIKRMRDIRLVWRLDRLCDLFSLLLVRMLGTITLLKGEVCGDVEFYWDFL